MSRQGAVDGWHRRVAGLAGQRVRFQLLFFVLFAALSGFAVFRNVYLEEMGLSGSAMGTIGFLLMATGVAAQPLWGVATDYWRAERPVLLVGAVVSALALLSYPAGASLPAPFLIVAAGTALFSAFRAPMVPIANGMVLSRGYDYGNIRAFGSVAFGIGSIGFGFLVAALGTVSIVYAYVAGMALLVVVVGSLSAETDRGSGRAGGPAAPDDGTAGNDAADENRRADGGVSVSRAVRALVTDGTFLVVLAGTFLLSLSTLGGSAFFSVYVRAVDAGVAVGSWSLSPDAVTGVAWGIKTAFEAVAFVYAVRLGFPYKWMLVLGGAAVALPNLVYGLTARPWAILAVQSVNGIGYALIVLAGVNLVHAVADERVTATAQTVLTGVGLGLGAAVGELVAGTLVDAVGLQRMYLVVAAVGFLGAVVGSFVGHRRRLDGSEPRR